VDCVAVNVNVLAMSMGCLVNVNGLSESRGKSFEDLSIDIRSIDVLLPGGSSGIGEVGSPDLLGLSFFLENIRRVRDCLPPELSARHSISGLASSATIPRDDTMLRVDVCPSCSGAVLLCVVLIHVAAASRPIGSMFPSRSNL
jgi:hypothetical protein